MAIAGAQIGSDILIAAADLASDSATALHLLGGRAVTPDGRSFRYCKAGAVALVPGTLQQSPAQITDHQDLTPVAATAGDTTLTVTLGATAATADQYAQGWVVVTVTPGQGYQYKILSHPAADSSGSLTLTLMDPIRVSLTTSSRVDLIPNQYSGVIINPATASSAPCGAAVTAITAGQYGWVQVGGPATLLADGAITVGTALVASNGTAGAVEPATGVQAPVGTAITGIATTEYGAVELMIE